MIASLERTGYQGWDAWSVRRGPLELLLVPEVGGRVMGVRWREHELTFTQPERRGVVEDVSAVADIHERKRMMGFPLWGGDKTWLAPQERWAGDVPFLDLDSGAYALDTERPQIGELLLRLTSGVCRETGIRIERQLLISAGRAGWRVTHCIRNASPREAEWGVWDVAMLLRPGRVYLPLNPESRYAGALKVFEKEGEICGDTCAVGRLGGLAVVRCEEPGAFKCGSDAREGWMLGILERPGGLVGYLKEVAVHEGAYPHGCVSEVFNSGRYAYLEMEMLGPLVALAPGASFALEERQAVFDVAGWPGDEPAVRRLVEQARRGSA